VRARLTVDRDIAEQDAIERALQHEAVQKHLGGATPQKTIYVPGRLVNLVG
jgi:leucyl-tRNA synthetase